MTDSRLTELKSLNSISIKMVDDFKYLGSYIADTQKHVCISSAFAWDKCNRLGKALYSNFPLKLKVKILEG